MSKTEHEQYYAKLHKERIKRFETGSEYNKLKELLNNMRYEDHKDDNQYFTTKQITNVLKTIGRLEESGFITDKERNDLMKDLKTYNTRLLDFKLNEILRYVRRQKNDSPQDIHEMLNAERSIYNEKVEKDILLPKKSGGRRKTINKKRRQTKKTKKTIKKRKTIKYFKK